VRDSVFVAYHPMESHPVSHSPKLIVRVLAIAALVGASALLGVVVGVRIVKADPAGPPTRQELTYSGVLSGVTVASTRTLTFTFAKMDAECPVTVTANVSATGAFSVNVPTRGCPQDFFNGADVSYSVSEGATTHTPAGGVAITPVPYARFADQVSVNNQCPVGFAKDTSVDDTIVCYRTIAGGRDEVVRVGNGSTAFWIDRYESSVYMRSMGTASSTFAGLSRNGQWTTGQRESLVAVSRPGVIPARNITWFQANAVCRASGKRMVRRDEWFAAADGLTAIEVGSNNCNVNNTPAGPRATGMGTICKSSWGVQDMIGNLWEWTDEWYAGTGDGSGSGRAINNEVSVWPMEYGNDRTWNINSAVISEIPETLRVGMPGAAIRGGDWGGGARAGVFTLDLRSGASTWDLDLGFRCVVPN
jgi:formylglycine-generating enzyme required for sulfatase activity